MKDNQVSEILVIQGRKATAEKREKMQRKRERSIV